MAPLIAASVSTRVVSWKEAAARKLEVLRDALVTPSRTVWAVAGSPPSARTRLLYLLEIETIDQLGREQVGVARLVDADLAEHLPDDDLDVLVVDRDALALVDLLNFLDEVALDGVLAPGVEEFLRVDRAVGDGVTGADLRAVVDQDLGVVGDEVLPLDGVLGANHETVVALDQEALTGAAMSHVAPSASMRARTWPRSTRSPGAASISAPSGRPRDVS